MSDRPRSTWWSAARFAAVGTVMGASVVAGLLVGMGLDRWLGTTPWLSVAGIVLGSVAGFRELYRALRAWEREEERERAGREDRP